MAHFQRPPSGERISDHVLTITNPRLIVGLWGYMAGARELTVTSSNSAISIARGGISGSSREWVITGADGADARVEAVLPGGGPAWDSFHLRFRINPSAAQEISVWPITQEIEGSEGPNHCVPVTTRPHPLISVPTFRAGDATNQFDFFPLGPQSARIGTFAVRKGHVVRAFILFLPESGTPDRILIGINNTLHQGDNIRNIHYYQNLGWGNPLSRPLIMDLRTDFVLNRYGPQVLGGRKVMALLMPVRNQGELGPFPDDGHLWKEALDSLSVLTGAFTVGHVEAFSFSSGIYDLNRILRAVHALITVETVYNIDPSHGIPAAVQPGVVCRQFLSGQTTNGPRAGFEFLPLPRWARESNRSVAGRIGTYGYLHNACLPHYALHLGIETS